MYSKQLKKRAGTGIVSGFGPFFKGPATRLIMGMNGELPMESLKNIFVKILLLMIIIMAGPGSARTMFAAGPDSEFRLLSTDQMKTMIDEKDKMGFLLIDARSNDEFQEAHIPGAINIPENRVEESRSLLPLDKNALIVFYCNGPKCGRSKKAAIKAYALGYRNILVYNDGFPIWEEKGYKIIPGPDYAKKIETAKLGPVELKKLIDAKAQDYVIVDVREPSEYQEGHVPGALNIPVDVFASRSEILPKEKKIIVYCNTGGRSYTAYRKLQKLAYPSIYQTLFAEWKDAGMLVEK